MSNTKTGQFMVDRPKYANAMRKSGMVQTKSGVVRKDMRKVRQPRFIKSPTR